GEHRLARTRRAQHQEVVAAGRGDLQRALGPDVTPHVGEVEPVRFRARAPGVLVGTVSRDLALAVQVFERVVERGERDDGDRGLGRVPRGHEEAGDATAPAVERHRKYAADRPDVAVERELADGNRVFDEPGLDDARGRENAQRYRQIEGGALLAELGGRQID